jgi:DNA-binding MarR family transcriptional regulator
MQKVPRVKSQSSFELTTAVLKTADAFLRESQRLFRPHGLTAAQYNVLNVLAPQPAGLSQRELSDALVVDRSNVTGLIDRMEKAGWVRRADDPADRRVYRITLTPAGRKLWSKVEPRYRAAIENVTQGVPIRQMTVCTELLNELSRRAAHWDRGAEDPS